MKRVLITGASGFVGANLARRLLADGHEVHLFLRPQYQASRIEEILPHVEAHFGDMLDESFLYQALAEAGPDWIFHLAACGAYSWQRDIREIVETNVLALEKLLSACCEQGFEAFVNAGSSSEYGYKDHAPSEEEVLEPNSYYAITKAAGTQLCTLLAAENKEWIPTLRLYSVYGPLEDPRRFIPTLVNHGLKGKLPILVDPNVARDYVYVDDVVNAFILAAQKRAKDCGSVYNIGSGVQTTIGQAVDCVRSLLPIDDEPSWGSMPNRDWDTSIWQSDPTKAERELGWKAATDFKSGLQKTIDWTRSRNITQHLQ